MFSDCRVQPIFCKDSANEGNESLFSDCRVQPIFCKDSKNIAKQDICSAINIIFDLSFPHILFIHYFCNINQHQMASRFNVIWSFISHYKYLIVIVVGVAVVGFLDENSYLRHKQYEIQISDMKAEIEKYNVQYEADSKKLRELRNDPKAIVKIARERYFMKADDEDIFILSDDEKPTKNNETAE